MWPLDKSHNGTWLDSWLSFGNTFKDFKIGFCSLCSISVFIELRCASGNAMIKMSFMVYSLFLVNKTSLQM